ncbi:MAG TPA: TIM barrel protein, partial [Thermoanaerobaculia bacterium]
PIVAHPEILRTPSLWRQLGERLCIENMDHRKTTGRTPGELRELFEIFPDAGFCLDLGHARQIDPTMASALGMLRKLGDRLRQVHVSEVGSRGEHLPLGSTARLSFRQVAHRLPSDCPLIIESVIPLEAMERELSAVAAALESAPPQVAMAY